MFVDRAVITVQAGKGGAGAVAWRKAKYEPKGGPHGGDGGKGGDVLLVADEGLNTLLDFKGRPLWEAEPGEDGMKKQMHGRDGADRVIRLPPGTMVFNNQSGELIVDLQPAQRFVVARGGKGGFGNEHYKSSTNQAPTYAHPGFPGEQVELRLDLKLIADVGLVGMPNAGKSTLLAALTRAHPKIAAYPFTTLAPQLGVAELDPARRVVIADIPGLIEGASRGAGLGLDFLRHVERTRVLVHLLDCQPPDGSDPADNYRTIRDELYAYSPVLAEREEVIVLNKLDLLPEDDRRGAVGALRAKLKVGREVEVLGLSGAAHLGTRDLLETLWRIVQRTPAPPAPTSTTAPVAEVEPRRAPAQAAAPAPDQVHGFISPRPSRNGRARRDGSDSAPGPTPPGAGRKAQASSGRSPAKSTKAQTTGRTPAKPKHSKTPKTPKSLRSPKNPATARASTSTARRATTTSTPAQRSKATRTTAKRKSGSSKPALAAGRSSRPRQPKASPRRGRSRS